MESNGSFLGKLLLKHTCLKNLVSSIGADPAFPSGGGDNPRGSGMTTYDFADFSKKLHEIKKILVRRGWGAHAGAPLGFATVQLLDVEYQWFQIKFDHILRIFEI